MSLYVEGVSCRGCVFAATCVRAGVRIFQIFYYQTEIFYFCVFLAFRGRVSAAACVGAGFRGVLRR
jgi:hypothetical protein